MVPSGPPTPGGGAQSVPQSLLRSNSGVLAGQGGPSQSSQPTFGSLSSPHMQIGNGMNMPGNASIMSSLLNQPFGNSGAGSVISGHRGVLETGGAESDPLSNVGNEIGFNAQSSFVPSTMINSSSSGQVRGQQFGSSSSSQLLSEQQQAQQLEIRNFQQAQHNQLMQQQQFQAARGGLAGVGPVKVEPQAVSDQYRQLHQPQQQLQAPRNVGSVKLEPQQFQTMRSMGQVKMEPQISDPSLFLQQQQQFLHMPAGQSSQAQLNLLQQQQQQRLLQLQQHQQHQLLKAMPQQRRQFPQQVQQQSLPSRPPTKPVYEPGMCAQRLTQYMYQQQLRPEDNNIEFWRKFVAEYFAPSARKRWCVSMYGSGRQTTGVFPQDAWHCEICNRKPGRGFEATVEVLPRLFKIKYESGTLEELLYVDMPRESQNAFGQIVLEYAKAIQESVFEQLRVVRDGQLRIVFTPDLKICSWEFCARRHEELIPRRLLIPQVSQLGSAAQKYQQAAQNASSDSPASDLQNNCNMFVASARQLAKALEVPLVNDLGYTKRYVRCLQISEVVNSMKDLIDYSRETRNGPIESLSKYPRRTGPSSTAVPGQAQGSDEQLRQQQQQNRTNCQNTNGNKSSILGGEMQVNPSNCTTTVNKSSASTIAGLLHQNSMNSRQQSAANNPVSPYGGNSVQMSSPSSSTIPVAQQHNISSFQSPTSSSNNNMPQQSQNGLPSTTHHMSAANSPAIQQPVPSGEADLNESQSSVQKILHEIMANNQHNSTGGGMVGTTSSFRNDVKNVNGTSPANNASVINGGGNGIVIGGSGFGMMGGGGSGGGGFAQSAAANGIRAVMGNNNNSVMNGRVNMMAQESSMNHQQQDLRNQLLGGLGAINGFNNLQFDWNGC